MNDYVREGLLDEMEPQQVADIAGQLETDDAVALIEDLDADEQQAVLERMEPDDRAAVEEALGYPEESAGRLMQRDMCAVPEHWNVGQVIDYLRSTRGASDRFLGSVRGRSRPPSGRHVQALDDPADAAQDARSARSWRASRP